MGPRDRAGDEAAADRLQKRERALQPAKAGAAGSGFQVNIRQPVESLGARQAASYLSRMVPVLEVLAGRAALDRHEAERIAGALGRICRGSAGGEPRGAEAARRESAARRRTAIAERRRPRRSVAEPAPALLLELGRGIGAVDVQ